jgi:hypothetical protein
MSQAHSPIPQLATELNPKPTFAVGDILLNRRCDFYHAVRFPRFRAVSDRTPPLSHWLSQTLAPAGYAGPPHHRQRRAMTREEKLASFGELIKVPGIKKASVFADEACNRARILIDHPHAGRDWTITGPAGERGFYLLTSRFRVNPGCYPEEYTSMTLCLPDTEFERLP